MKRIFTLILIIIALFSELLSQENQRTWIQLDINEYSLKIPNQEIRKTYNEKSITKKLFNTDISDCIIDSIEIETESGKLRCNLSISKSSLTKSQMDSLATVSESLIREIITSEFPNTEVQSNKINKNETIQVIINNIGIKEYMTVLIWYCNGYIFSAALEDVSIDHVETQYFLDNLNIN